MNKESLQVFAMAKVAMDTFKQRYDSAKKRKKQRFDDLNANFKPGSPMFVQERDRITPEYEAEIEKAREKCKKEFIGILETTIAKERAAATVTGGSVNNILETLKCLETIPVSVDEYTALVDTLGGKLYWVDRRLAQIAEKNGIRDAAVQPSLTVKLQVLNRLEADVTEFLNDYNGEDKSFIITNSDGHIYNLENEYTNGYSHVNMSGREQAKRMVTEALRKGDSMERACYLANMLRTSAPELQMELLTELSERDSAVLYDPTMNFVGISSVIEDFRKTEYAGIKKAEKTIEQIKGEKLKHNRETIAFQNLENRYFMDAVKKSGDRELKSLVKEMQEVKAAGEAKEKREVNVIK
ncbi:MAG: hypothetical protein NC548_53950 [Lachnospiraceae bacterium]|nr:hypothetical protein [Lachnospiraceae bacterium]